ncbi:hypothetical protein [Kitasatospora sp. Root107]|uniref:hypothetical protein n=1 Tax=Kitasatospora sp. Root107 TaxID=1736424 RepID=UPI00070FA704|nr:hypothetical protein [Kitasatospora sp. Root107]KQV16625.1 hypothetical protein ASC99_28035 [Kitasatospora sp. Root107]
MKKRSLLAAASLAAGVALSLTAPHAHATGDTTGLVGASGSEAVTGTEAATDVLPVSDAETVSGTGTSGLITG